MKRHLLALLTLLLPSLALAQEFEKDGVWYVVDEANIDGAIVIAHPDKYRDYVYIPETVTYGDHTYTVLSIADCAFIDCHDLISVQIASSSLTDIGFSAFERCYNLATLVLPEGLVSFDYEAFKDCHALRSVRLPSTLKYVGDRSFLDCTSLQTINIPASVRGLGDLWLSGCPLQYLIVEREEPLSIKANVFKGLDKQACILSVPQGTKQAYQTAKVWRTFAFIDEDVRDAGQCGDDAFYTIHSDMTMTIMGTGEMWNYHDVNTTVGYNSLTPLFDKVTQLTVEDGITTIGNDAFPYFTSLTDIQLPASMASIGTSAFASCTSLATINFEEGLEYIGESAFFGCRALTEVVLPNSLTQLDGGNNFDGCTSLASLTIGSGITHIWGWTFNECTSLASITVNNSTPPALGYYIPEDGEYVWASSVFQGVNKQTCVLRIPEGSRDAYASAEGWKDFLTVEQFDPNQGATAIEAVRPTDAAATQIYDLHGRRLNSAKGHTIVIENGRKRIVR